MPLKGPIIILRFSAMGDVAMVASVLKDFNVQNPEAEMIMVSRAFFKPFFKDINHLTFHAIEPKTFHKGLFGLFKLYKSLSKYQPVAIADLHDNLRSRVIATFFRLAGIQIQRIDKGRKEKKALTRVNNKIFKQLKTTVERYADVFRKLDFKLELKNQLIRSPKQLPTTAIPLFDNPHKKIGISPFAQHIYKVYPFSKMEDVIAELVKLDYQIYIFGGGNEEKIIAENWQNKFEQVNSLIGKFTLAEELEVISNLDVMLSMDSAGMHMASLMGVPVVSIWGPTHPHAGFLGYGQSLSNCVQVDNPNRPNSIYGNKPCQCGVESCMDKIDPTTVVDKIKENL